MRLAVIGCNMMRKDLEPLVRELQPQAETVWLDEQLHDRPERLREELQKQIDALQDADEILLLFLLCGNALLGVHSGRVPLRFLKGDDCICACMSDRPDYAALRPRSIFLSRGWLSFERNPFTDYERTLRRYGAEKTAYIYRMMYGNYRNVIYMQLGGEPMSDEDRKKTEDMASLLQLEPMVLEGSLERYRRLLRREEGPEVAVIGPGRGITLQDTGIFG